MSFERPDNTRGVLYFSTEKTVSLSSLDNPAWETIRGVCFSMLDGNVLSRASDIVLDVQYRKAVLDQMFERRPELGRKILGW